MTILVTGGAGFIGSNFVIDWLKERNELVVNLDALTSAGNSENLVSLQNHELHEFVCGDVQDRRLVDRLLARFEPRAIVHFAAESHAESALNGTDEFIRTNINGTYTLIEAAHQYWHGLEDAEKAAFRFLHVSTDEVYGSLGPDAPAFVETAAHQPNSPYSASKAAADCLVRGWHHSYGLPTLTANCPNIYGPQQFPTKLVPQVIDDALAGHPLRVYGDGMNTRNWLYVGDYCAAMRALIDRGVPGEVYNIGGENEIPALTIVKTICAQLDELHPGSAGSYSRLITFVDGKRKRDRRHAIDTEKIHNVIGWRALETIETGLRKTVEWYLANQGWVENVETGAYQQWQWISRNYSSQM